jgi:hypothetical protein
MLLSVFIELEVLQRPGGLHLRHYPYFARPRIPFLACGRLFLRPAGNGAGREFVDAAHSGQSSTFSKTQGGLGGGVEIAEWSLVHHRSMLLVKVIEVASVAADSRAAVMRQWLRLTSADVDHPANFDGLFPVASIR